jgi:hypothetical protein
MKSRRTRWTGHVAHMAGMRNAYNILVGKPEDNRILGRLRRRWEDNIRMGIIYIGKKVVDWMHLAYDRD